MLIVDYQSKSYYRFLNDMYQIAAYKKRFLITFNGASEIDLATAISDLSEQTKKEVLRSSVIANKASENAVSAIFNDAREKRHVLLFEQADVLYSQQTAVKKAHEREHTFDLNFFFKSIAKHNGVVVLATENKQTLSASMSTKMDVVVRFSKQASL